MAKIENNAQTKASELTHLLVPIERKFLFRGDRVKLRNGEIVTIKGLEYNEFTAFGKKDYIKKSKIEFILE